MSRLRHARGLRILAALLVFSVTACAGDDGDGAPPEEPAANGTEHDDGTEPDAGEDDGSEPDTGDDGGVPDDGTTSPDEEAQAISDDEQAELARAPGSPPEPGTYRYDVTREPSDDEGPAERTLVIEPGPGGAATSVQRARGGGDPVHVELAWGADGVFVTATHFDDDRCPWEPAWTWYRFPLTVGDTWDYGGRCEFSANGARGFREIRGTATVTGTQATIVAGERVPVVVLEREERFIVEITEAEDGVPVPPPFRRELTREEQFSPAHGLVVRYHEVVRSTGIRGMVEGTRSGVLRSLSPQ